VAVEEEVGRGGVTAACPGQELRGTRSDFPEHDLAVECIESVLQVDLQANPVPGRVLADKFLKGLCDDFRGSGNPDTCLDWL
jgi:hypothetical protein